MLALMIVLLVGSLATAVFGALWLWTLLERWVDEGRDRLPPIVEPPAEGGGKLRREKRSYIG